MGSVVDRAVKILRKAYQYDIVFVSHPVYSKAKRDFLAFILRPCLLALVALLKPNFFCLLLQHSTFESISKSEKLIWKLSFKFMTMPGLKKNQEFIFIV